MITVDFSKRKGVGLCEYLYRSIKKQILNGTLASGEHFPSRRALAEHLHISVITVQNAYARLISEGYVYSLEKKGFFVEDVYSIPKGIEKRKGFEAAASISNGFTNSKNIANSKGIAAASMPKNSSIHKGIASPKLIAAARPVSASATASYFADFKSNATSFEKFPFSLWAKIMRQVLNSGDERLLVRQPAGGALELRKAICSHLRQFRMIDAQPEQIIVGAGTDFLYSMLVQFLGTKKIYAVENPGYQQMGAVAKLCGAKCVPVKIDQGGISISGLKKSRAQIVHVSPQHHFPTGIVMPYKRRLELLAWAAEKSDRIIIEDDYDSEFRFNGTPLEPLYSIDNASRVIYINTFSKTLSPSFRISYMVLPKNLLGAFGERTGFFSCPVPSFEQFALARFIGEGYYEKHLIKMKNYYRSLRNNLIAALSKSKINSIAKIKEENSGLHFLLQVESQLSGKELQSRLLEQGINIALLSDFYYDKSSEQNDASEDAASFVVNYSGLKKDKIAQTVRRMEKGLL